MTHVRELNERIKLATYGGLLYRHELRRRRRAIINLLERSGYDPEKTRVVVEILDERCGGESLGLYLFDCGTWTEEKIGDAGALPGA